MRMKLKQKVLAVLTIMLSVSSVVGMATYVGSAEETCAVTMRGGAYARIGSSQNGTGIRFVATVDESLLSVSGETVTFKTDDAVTEVGMIIAPAKALAQVQGNDIFAYFNEYGVAKQEISTQFADEQIQKDSKGYYVAGAIVKIQDANLDLEYQAIPYTYDGESYTYGAASDKRTISDVFNSALNYKGTTEEEKATHKLVLEKAIELNDKLDISTEISVADGGDLSAYTADGYVIDSVTLGGATVTISDDVIAGDTLDKTAAKKDAQTLTINYVSTEGMQKSLNVNAQVWSLYIDEAVDLVTNMKNYAYSEGINDYGYYKLVDDLEMTSANEVGGNFVTPNDQSRFQGVLDGNGKTVNNLGLKYRSLFGAMGQNAIVKDINFTNVHYSATKNTLYSHSAILGSWVYGGTVENVSVTYTIPDSSYTATGTAPTMCGILFGQVFPAGLGNCFSINLTNVSITALNAESSANTTFAPLGYASQSKDIYNKPIYTATNVTVVGCEGIYVNSSNAMVTEVEGITYKTGKPVALTGVDTEIGQTINFADYIQGKEIQSVTYNGETVGTSVTFSDKTQASATPRNYVVTTTDGEKTIVPVTVWSLLINEPAELTNGSMNRASYSVGNAVYGYYKITDDLNMTGAGNVCQGGSTPMVAPTNYSTNTTGFQGVFDGGNHTVSNLNIQYRSLFGAIGKDAIFRNVNFANVTYYATKNAAYTNSAILGSWVNGGTVENVTVTYTISNNFNTVGDAPTLCGVLFGQIYPTGGVWSRVILKDVTITALNASTATNTNFAVLGALKTANHSAWAGKYFDATNVTITGAGIFGDLTDNTIFKKSGNGITYNAT